MQGMKNLSNEFILKILHHNLEGSCSMRDDANESELLTCHWKFVGKIF